MGNLRMGPPEPLILALAKELGADTFIEGGTYRGATARWASTHFRTVHTIERAPAIYAETRLALQARTNITCHLGDTREILPGLVASLAAPCILWLDAHWSGGITAGQTDECPLLDEIAVLNSCSQPLAILIDDARCFLAPPPLPHAAEQWPGLTDLIPALLAGGPRTITVIEDVIVAVPPAQHPRVVEYCRSVNQREEQALSAPALVRHGAKQVARGLLRLARGA